MGTSSPGVPEGLLGSQAIPYSLLTPLLRSSVYAEMSIVAYPRTSQVMSKRNVFDSTGLSVPSNLQ